MLSPSRISSHSTRKRKVDRLRASHIFCAMFKTVNHCNSLKLSVYVPKILVPAFSYYEKLVVSAHATSGRLLMLVLWTSKPYITLSKLIG